jgi:phage terminase large subunit-like protein
MRALGGDSKTQDGINCHVGIIDEYHAHKDDTVKENLESSTVQRTQANLSHHYGWCQCAIGLQAI